MPSRSDTPGDLAERYLPLAMKVARRTSRYRPNLRDEAESVALVGLARAVATYDPARGAPATHVERKVHSAVCGFFRAELKARWKDAPEVIAITDEEDGGGAVARTLTARDDTAARHEAWEHLTHPLGPREKQLFHLIFVENMGIAEAGSVLGLGRVMASKHYGRALRKLRSHVGTREAV